MNGELWVYITGKANQADGASLDLLKAGKALAKEGGFGLRAIVVGDQMRSVAEGLSEVGIPEIYFISGPEHLSYDTMRITDTLESLVKEKEPEIILFPTGNSSGAIAAALGVRLRTGVVAHGIALRLNEHQKLVTSLAGIGGQFTVDFTVPDRKPQIAIARVSVPEQIADEHYERGIITTVEPPVRAERAISIEKVEEEVHFGASLTEAKIVVAGGAGIRTAENWNKLVAFAEALGAAVGCTRSTLDLNCGAKERELIGTTGVAVTPDIYIGFGISGDAHHMVGMKDASIIVNVNKDERNHFFTVSDYGFVGDAGEVLDQLLVELKK